MATNDVESLCIAHGLQPEKAKLDAVITEDHILDIAKFITDCTLVGKRLGLSNAQMEEVEAVQGGGGQRERLKKVKMLEIWRESQYLNATYRRLVQALMRLEMNENAFKVCQLLGLQQTGL